MLEKATNVELAIGPLRAQVHLLLVSCVVAASHRALDVTNRDEMPDVAFGGLAAFGISFALWRPSTQRSLPIGLNWPFGRTAIPSISGRLAVVMRVFCGG